MMLAGRKPTAAEKRWIDRIMEDDIGCICCRLHLNVYTPAEIHHISGKVRPGAHTLTLPLCFWHHRSGVNDETCVSRHPYKTEFEIRFGTELKLLEATRELVRGSDGV